MSEAQIVYRSGSNPVVFFGGESSMPTWAEDRLKGYMDAAGVESLQISSGYRSPEDQARIMSDNVRNHGIASQRALYGHNGNLILDEYPDQAAMAARIRSIGPDKVSKHMAEDAVVFDIAPSSIPGSGFEDLKSVMKAAPQNVNWRQDPDTIYEIGELLYPPKDPALHVEFPGNSAGVLADDSSDGSGLGVGDVVGGALLAFAGYKAVKYLKDKRKR